MKLTQDQCDSFNAYQRSGFMHPFSCGFKGHDGSDELVAEEDGLKCPSCNYRQDWAHSWMLDRSWETAAIKMGYKFPENTEEK